MPHVAFAPFTGFRVREPEMLELGMSLPGLAPRARAIAGLPSLGLLTLAGMTPETWTRSWHAVERCTQQWVEEIVDCAPDIVAISALTASVDEAYEFSRTVRERGFRTVIGGLHATTCADEAVEHCDSVVVGEGEPVWQNVLCDAERGELAPVYRSNSPTPDWPLPQFDLLGCNPPRYTIQTQRGCPFACDFCAASRLISPFREKPVEAIAAELSAICGMASRPLLELADDNTFARSRDVAELLDVLTDSGVRYFTEADWRIGERPDVLTRLASSGCEQVLIGLESLVFRYPGLGAKGAELNRMMDAVYAIQEAGVAVNGCFIVGADGETERSLDALTLFILESSLADVQVTLQTPFPGTDLRQRLRRAGRLLDERGWSSYTLFDLTYQPDKLTVEQLESGFRRVLTDVFSSAASTRRNQIRRSILRSRRDLTDRAVQPDSGNDER
ncbi:MAG: radical SAM protein [Pirellulaceae bacterium]|jgi:radical SAM superfamily enzyme YgiQ (UPF0313 family)|nr:radical SAM protein [Pirellulaceae bacterium]MDP7016661.1 radical SAM protein [Pirellulaceae bacterium]